MNKKLKIGIILFIIIFFGGSSLEQIFDKNFSKPIDIILQVC